jgi:hypothetical protein
MNFLIYLGASLFWALVATFTTNRWVPNQVLAICGACGSKLHARTTTKRWIFIDSMSYALVGWVFIWRYNVPLLYLPVFWVLYIIAWAGIVVHITRMYWFWRHPMRCDGSNHMHPVPQGA